MLLAIRVRVFRKSTGGNLKVRQSSEEPLRTTSALVKAANIIEMANSTTQMAVEDGGGDAPTLHEAAQPVAVLGESGEGQVMVSACQHESDPGGNEKTERD